MPQHEHEDGRLAMAAEQLRALAHPFRMLILECIDDHSPISSDTLYQQIGPVDKSIISQHLRILKSASILIVKEKDSKIYYSIDYDLVDHIVTTVNRFLKK